jgi:hypothetical protein
MVVILNGQAVYPKQRFFIGMANGVALGAFDIDFQKGDASRVG